MGGVTLFQVGTSGVFAVPDYMAAEIAAHAKLVAVENKQAFVLDTPVQQLTMGGNDAESQRL